VIRYVKGRSTTHGEDPWEGRRKFANQHFWVRSQALDAEALEGHFDASERPAPCASRAPGRVFLSERGIYIRAGALFTRGGNQFASGAANAQPTPLRAFLMDVEPLLAFIAMFAVSAAARLFTSRFRARRRLLAPSPQPAGTPQRKRLVRPERDRRRPHRRVRRPTRR
jgi:hypothetical protein